MTTAFINTIKSALPMLNVKAITFDAGGTLLFPHPSVGEIYAEVMMRHGVVVAAELLEAAFHETLSSAIQRPRVSKPGEHSDRIWWREVVRETLADLGEPDDFDAMFDDLWQEFAHPSRWRLCEGALGTLATLRARGYRLALLSNWDDRLRGLVAGLKLEPFFEHLIISCEVGSEKPDGGIFSAAQRALAVEPADILHVGDSVHHDFGGATTMGWDCVIVSDYDGHELPAGRHIRCLTELLDLLPDRCG